MQHCTKFCNWKSAKRRELTIIGWEQGLKGTWSRKFKPPWPPTRHPCYFILYECSFSGSCYPNYWRVLHPKINKPNSTRHHTEILHFLTSHYHWKKYFNPCKPKLNTDHYLDWMSQTYVQYSWANSSGILKLTSFRYKYKESVERNVDRKSGTERFQSHNWRK